jgi:magnesium chelatase subunit I
MDITKIKTLGDLKKAGYRHRSVKEEIRENLIKRLKNKETTFPNILGYEDSVIPDTERALLSRHNILFLGLRGQAKTRMARQMVELLDEYIPYVTGSEINDDPFRPISKFARDLLAAKGDDIPVTMLHRSERYGEKLATPDVSVADLIGDIDPIKAANLRLNFADEQVIHFGIIPKSNRGIFVINEIPDLRHASRYLCSISSKKGISRSADSNCACRWTSSSCSPLTPKTIRTVDRSSPR